MKVKLIAFPFHWVHPSASEKYAGCTVSVPVYDPDAPERDAALVRAARVVSFNAAVGSVPGRKYRGPKLPTTVLVPTAVLTTTWRDVGNGRRLARLALKELGFRRYEVCDLMSLPFAACKGEYVRNRTVKKLERT